jgi:hypothetical protein
MVILLRHGGNQITVEIISDATKAYQDLESVFPHIVRALEHGLLEAQEHFESKLLDHDGSAFSTLVRLHARDYLRAREMEAEGDLELERVNLCGLWMKIGRYHIKIWKISEDDLKKALERQHSGYQLALIDENGIPLVMELAVYWTADGDQVGQLHLVLPRYDDPRCFEWVWSMPIPQMAAVVDEIQGGDVPIEEAVRDSQQ